jgi:arylsulfatase A-like enzyme
LRPGAAPESHPPRSPRPPVAVFDAGDHRANSIVEVRHAPGRGFEMKRHMLRSTSVLAVLSASMMAQRGIAADPVEATPGTYLANSTEAPKQLPPIAKGKPNIIWILFDDLGFGASSAFGGLVDMPNISALADSGLRYNNFHTTGMCAPTRAAMLTGRNHHNVGMGMFPHAWLSAGFPGYTGQLKPQDGTIAEYLRDAGYSTYALGKWHLTPDEEAGELGPFDRWPTGKGFEHFFGFLGGATDQYKPDLIEDNRRVVSDGRHLNAQLVDKAINYISVQQRANKEKPFFMYIATGATHSPHQVDQKWIDKYRGRFDSGWDDYRKSVLAQQKKLGVIPMDAVLPPREGRIGAWKSLSRDERKVSARFMEAFAGFGEYTDWEIGRLISYLRDQGLLDNTIICVVLGDNGGSPEGGVAGVIGPELIPPTGPVSAQIATYSARIAEIGTRTTHSNYPMGWAEATNTPFRYWKAAADAEGGTRNPMILYWKGKIPAASVREQYAHVTDLLPTTLDMAGVSAPAEVRKIQQNPIQGISLSYSFSTPGAPTHHGSQYYFFGGAGAIYQDGWKASFKNRPDFMDMFRSFPPRTDLENPAGKEVWQLYDLRTDFNERHDLARTHPEKLRQLKEIFSREALDNKVYPLINWFEIITKNKPLLDKLANTVSKK